LDHVLDLAVSVTYPVPVPYFLNQYGTVGTYLPIPTGSGTVFKGDVARDFFVSVLFSHTLSRFGPVFKSL